MAVEDHAVHPKVKHTRVQYGCWNLSREQRPYIVPVRLYNEHGDFIGHGTQHIPPTMSALCRNTGEYSKDAAGGYSWKDDKNCEGCNPLNKDHVYISKMRRLVEQEMRKV